MSKMQELTKDAFCKSCGYYIRPEDRVCRKCGAVFLLTPITDTSIASEPPSPKWFVVVLTALWPVELAFSCILASSFAVVVWGTERNLVQLISIALFVGAVGYLLGLLIITRWNLPHIGWDDISTEGGCVLKIFGIILGAVFMVYYAIVASVCRHIIFPIVFRIAGISDAWIPSVFDGL